MSDISKSELRKMLLKERRALDTDSSALICRNLVSFLTENTALYYPIVAQNEVDLRSLFTPATLLPRIEGEHLTFYPYTHETTLTQHPTLPLLEPEKTTAITPKVIILPMVGFSRDGTRLGYGGGYYDRSLATRENTLLIGAAYSMQEVDSIPKEDHDIGLDIIITEKEVIHLS